jgi:hypothetical protein
MICVSGPRQHTGVSSVGQMNCCWPSLAQLILVSGPVGIHTRIFVLSQTFKCFETESPLRRQERSDYYWSLPLYWGLLGRSLTH